MQIAAHEARIGHGELASFFQFIDQDLSDSLILAATNYPQFLDYALFRRFDDVIEYHVPTDENRGQLLKSLLSGKKTGKINFKSLIEESKGLSYAEITRAIEDVLKMVIIDKHDAIQQNVLSLMIAERQLYHQNHMNHKHKSNE